MKLHTNEMGGFQSWGKYLYSLNLKLNALLKQI